MARDVIFDLRRGGGSALELLYGEVSISPTLLHSVSTSVVLPAPTKADLIAGKATFTQVAPSPAPVGGQVDWCYKVVITDRRGKTWEYLVGVPDGVPPINFNVLPRYSETRPPAFGTGPQGPSGTAATVAVGTVVSAEIPAVTNSGTSTNAVLNFTLAKGDKGDTGAGVNLLSDGERVATDPPSAWVSGTSIMQVGATQNGWPTNHGVVTTVKRFNSGRAVTYFSNNNGRSWERTATFSGDTWNSFREVAFSDVATTTVNGLMSATDKVNLDAPKMAVASKVPTDAPNTYPSGYSLVLGTVSSGWPGTGTHRNVVTFLALGNSGSAVQYAYPNQGAATDILYRQALTSTTWGDWQTIATASSVSKLQTFVTPEQYGALGNGTTDDSTAIETAINSNLTSGKDVLFDSAKTYRITRPIISAVPALGQKYSVGLGSTGTSPATIRMDNDGHRHFEFAGAEFGEVSLTTNTRLQSRAWGVSSTTSFSSGMLMGVYSTVSWFYDPRPESTDARVSEIEKVAFKEGNTLYSEGPSMDGYSISQGAVKVVPIQPIKVEVRNLLLTRPAPAVVAPDADLTYVGIRLDYALDSVVENVRIENACAVAVQVRRSYNTLVRDSVIDGTNSYGTGYAVSFSGGNYNRMSGCYITNTRRGCDVTANTPYISRNTTIEGNTFVGGGKNVRGEWFGWDPVTDVRISRNGGFGSHGVSDHTTVRNNLTMNCWEPYVIRGSNNIYEGNKHVGNAYIAVFGLDSGGGTAIVQNNNAISGWLGTDKYAFSANAGRAKDFVRVGPGFDIAQARIMIMGNYAEVQSSFVLCGDRYNSVAYIPSDLRVMNNFCGFSDGTTAAGSFLENPSGTLAAAGSKWVIGPNQYKHDTGAGTVNLTKGINLAGSLVTNYTTSGATT